MLSKYINVFLREQNERQKNKNTGSRLSKSIFRIFYENMLEAHNHYLKHKNNIQYLYSAIDNISQLPTSIKDGKKNNYLPHTIISHIHATTDNVHRFTFKLNGKHYCVYFYTTHTNPITNINILNNHMKNIYMWYYCCGMYTKSQCSKVLNIHIFLTEKIKELPELSKIIGAEHVNSAFTYLCSTYSTEITIFRQEEWFKVLCHETMHNFGLDFGIEYLSLIQHRLGKLFPIRSEFLLNESYCEFWATVWNVVFVAYFETHPSEQNIDINVNTTFKTFSLIAHKYLEIEKKFAVFQAVKILGSMTINYNDILSMSQKCSAYNETTNVFCYYIIKMIFLFNYDEFILLLLRKNTNIINFDVSFDSINSIIDFIQQHYSSPLLINEINKQSRVLESISMRDDQYLFSTLRMTMLG